MVNVKSTEPVDLRDVIDKRLDDMLTKSPPEMWGSDEAYDLQLLLLIELRYFARSSDRACIMSYLAFLRRAYPMLGPRCLSTIASGPVIARAYEAFRAFLSSPEHEGRTGVLCPTCRHLRELEPCPLCNGQGYVVT